MKATVNTDSTKIHLSFEPLIHGHKHDAMHTCIQHFHIATSFSTQLNHTNEFSLFKLSVIPIKSSCLPYFPIITKQVNRFFLPVFLGRFVLSIGLGSSKQGAEALLQLVADIHLICRLNSIES